ncbi:MAG: outer membrane beta-barrel protein [Bacteroidales bacterium]|nr:outer membrane beta-barrel protein [Bacteroidales bacterium]
MPIDDQNIDKLFQANLKGFKEKPPVYAWDKIKEELALKRKSKRLMLFRWSAAAAAIFIAFLTGYYFASFNLNDEFSEPQRQEVAALTESNANKTAEENQVTAQIFIDEPSHSLDNEAIAINESMQVVTTDDEAIAINESLFVVIPDEKEMEQTKKKPASPEPINSLIDKPVIHPNQLVPSGAESLAFDADWVIPKTEKKLLKWSVGGKFAPVYAYRDISIKTEDLPSTIIPDESYYNNLENEIYSFSGGVDLKYHIRKKLSFQTGLFYSKLGQVNNDVVAYRYPDDKYEFVIPTSVGPIDINSEKIPKELADSDIREDSTGNILYFNADIYQNFEYIEVPLLINYKILDKRFGIQLAGGLSPGFMVNNSAYFQVDKQEINIDRTEEFYTVIYNSIVGLGLNYAVSKKINFSLAPTFKYSLRSIRKDHSIEYYPYSFSIYTGISYSF